MKQQEIKSIHLVLEELKMLKISKSNTQKLIDMGLDMYNYIKESKLKYKDLFLNNWKINIEKFSDLDDEDFNMSDIEKYWNDYKEEMVFDLETLIAEQA